MIVGATTPYRWLLITHIVSISAGSILLGIHLLRDNEFLTPLLKKINIGVLVVVVLFPIGAKLIQHYLPNETYLVENPALPPTSMYEEGGGTTGHFFPASVETETGALDSNRFLSYIGDLRYQRVSSRHLSAVERIRPSFLIFQ